MPEGYLVNDHVLYLNSGICKIDDIRTEDFSGMGRKTYYVMHALTDPRSVIYIPVDSDTVSARLFRLLTPDEIDEVICSSRNDCLSWECDSKRRIASLNALIDTGDRANMLRVIDLLIRQRREAEKIKKKLYANDERVLARAKALVIQEFSFVLGIGPDDVAEYVLQKLAGL